jgi:hypothetical protein
MWMLLLGIFLGGFAEGFIKTGLEMSFAHIF